MGGGAGLCNLFLCLVKRDMQTFFYKSSDKYMFNTYALTILLFMSMEEGRVLVTLLT